MVTSTKGAYGTPEHAAAATSGRHPGIRDGLQWLTFSHLPPALRRFSAPFYTAALDLIQEVSTDSPELTTAINGLIAAKDSAVRAGIRHDTGRAGSVPRPQEVLAPPSLTGDALPVAPADTEPGCQHPDCIRQHPHTGPAFLPRPVRPDTVS